MADIVELVIKIPESEIPKRQDIIEIPLHFIDGKVCEVGGYGFDVLPKGHGRLGDLDKIKREMQNYYDDCAKTSEYTRLGFETAMAVVEGTSTIIEADKEDNDEYKCKNCLKAYTDDCPKEKCWKNNYSEFIEENK